MKAAIIGGDKRMLYAAKAFLDSDFPVAVAGFDDLQSQCGIRITSVEEAVQWADFSVLPIRPLSNGALFCPYQKKTISIERFAAANGTKPVFSGCAKLLYDRLGGPVHDYDARDDFAVKNAALTAEGALGLLLREHEDSLLGMRTLLLGYGRIARILSRYLSALGAEVTVAARKSADRAWIESAGLSSTDFSLKEINSFDVLINTVPARVIDAPSIDRLSDTVFLLDLASAPGGFDRSRVAERGLTFFDAPGLPGKTAPKAAGRIIKETVINIIKEENGGKDNSGLGDDRLLLHL